MTPNKGGSSTSESSWTTAEHPLQLSQDVPEPIDIVAWDQGVILPSPRHSPPSDTSSGDGFFHPASERPGVGSIVENLGLDAGGGMAATLDENVENESLAHANSLPPAVSFGWNSQVNSVDPASGDPWAFGSSTNAFAFSFGASPTDLKTEPKTEPKKQPKKQPKKELKQEPKKGKKVDQAALDVLFSAVARILDDGLCPCFNRYKAMIEGNYHAAQAQDEQCEAFCALVALAKMVKPELIKEIKELTDLWWEMVG